MWICPSHRYFEWFIDVLRDVERKDVTNVLEMHIFITQFFHKFDLRTTMLVSPTYLFVGGLLLYLLSLSPGASVDGWDVLQLLAKVFQLFKPSKTTICAPF